MRFQHFIDAQAPVIDAVMAELAAGRKRTHWMWFIFPQLTMLGRSSTAKHFGIDTVDEARAYLAQPVLGQRLKACTRSVLAHDGPSANAIFGSPDDLKFRSCMTLFSLAAPDEPLFRQALERFCAGRPDPLTVAACAGGDGSTRAPSPRAEAGASHAGAMIEIRPAALPADLPVVRRLLREYADGLGVDVCFQDFEAELASLPGKYAPPRGRLLLAWNDHRAVGCVALRPIDDETCEMKRLYVKPEERALHLGRRLAERICREARATGYRRMCLDTLPTMHAALGLYASLGFRPVAPYVFNPVAGALFLGLDL